MIEPSQIRLPFASISGKVVEADFAGGAVTSDGGVLLLRALESQMGLIARMVDALRDRRHPSYIDHTLLFRSLAAMKMPSIVMICATIRASRLPAIGFLFPVLISGANQR